MISPSRWGTQAPRRNGGSGLILLPVILLVACLFLVDAPLQAQVVRGHSADRVDAVFEEWDRTHRPGAAVVVLRDGEILHMDGYGMADLEQGVPITPSTVFDIASVSKHFTGWAVAGLEAQGRLSVDDPIDRYLPEIPTFDETITVWHLLHHTSGIRDWVELFAVAGWSFDDVITVPDVITLARHQQALNFRPGTAYAYSNTAYNLLAEIVARVSGTSFRAYMEENAFRPLGMRSTHVHDVYNEPVPQRARSYAPLEEDEEAWELWVNNTSAVGSSSVFTTVADMARWMENLDPGEVGGRERLELMLQPTVLEDGDTVSYGYGLSLGEHRGLKTVSHGGGWRGYRTHLLRFPEEGLSVAVFANFSTFPSFETAARVAEVYLEDQMAPRVTEEDEDEDVGSSTFFEDGDTTAVPISADALTAYEGRYFSEELGTFYTMERDGEQLVARHRINEDRTTTHLGDDTFVMPGVRGEQTLRFTRDGEGHVTGYTLEGRRFKGILFRKMPE